MLHAGVKLGPYEISAPLGAGGMGEVYRARDTRLDRDVAIKVLPNSMTRDADRIARFEREAKVLASLNHPNIGAIHGFETAEARKFLVLEFVEGETLAQRLKAGALPVDEALGVCKQIAEALEAAHEKSIVHRDLKPGNVMLRTDGTVKVLDFGLARAMADESTGIAALPDSPTATSPARGASPTMPGVILGTAGYMSPEQARGKPVDKRSDIFSFGCVLYEMLTGRGPFPGETTTDSLGAILHGEPDWTRLPPTTPPRIRELLANCLAKERKNRLHDLGDARLEIDRAISGCEWITTADIATAARPRFTLTFLALASTVSFLLIAAGWLLALRLAPRAAGVDRQVVRLNFVPPDDVEFNQEIFDSVIVSPDGKKLLFTGGSAGGKRQLWLRPLDSLAAQPLPNTDDAMEPFWSPDSRSVGFGSHGQLRRLDIGSGRVQSLCDAPWFNGGTWNRKGMILFSPHPGSGLFQVPAAGGEPIPVTRPDSARGDLDHNLPYFLPDGRHFLFRVGTGREGPAQVYVGSLDSQDVKQVLADSASAAFAPPGWLLYVHNGELLAQAFDLGRLELTGEPFRVAATSMRETTYRRRFSVSENGVLILQSIQVRDCQLIWFDRAGRRLGTLGAAIKAIVGYCPKLSPDGKRVVIQRQDPQTHQRDLWVIDVARETFDRLTTDPATEDFPVWSPDGARVVFSRFKEGSSGIYQIPATGGSEQLLLGGMAVPGGLSPDGQFLFYSKAGEKNSLDIWALQLSGDAQSYRVLDSEFEESWAQVSPDGHWLAYTSDVTGAFEVYVRPLTTEGRVGEALRISTSGGLQPRWRPDGKELFYIAAPLSTSYGQMMAVSVTTSGTTLDFSAATPLFKTHMLPNQFMHDYDVTADGERFLVGTVVGEASATGVSIILNWTAALSQP